MMSVTAMGYFAPTRQNVRFFHEKLHKWIRADDGVWELVPSALDATLFQIRYTDDPSRAENSFAVERDMDIVDPSNPHNKRTLRFVGSGRVELCKTYPLMFGGLSGGGFVSVIGASRPGYPKIQGTNNPATSHWSLHHAETNCVVVGGEEPWQSKHKVIVGVATVVTAVGVALMYRLKYKNK